MHPNEACPISPNHYEANSDERRCRPIRKLVKLKGPVGQYRSQTARPGLAGLPEAAGGETCHQRNFPVFEIHARYVSKENYFDVTGDPNARPSDRAELVARFIQIEG